MSTELFSVAGRSTRSFVQEVSQMGEWEILEQLDQERYLLDGAGEWKGLFALHRFPVQLDRRLQALEQPQAILQTVLEGLELDPLGAGRFGFQLSANQRVPWKFGDFCSDLLSWSGLPPEQYDPRRPEFVLSLRLHREESGFRLMAGCSSVQHNLSPWAGGECRIPRDPEAVSRAEAKLLEAWEAFGLGEVQGRALDLGAAPGGWTRVLAQRGLMVDAVDPAELHPSVVQLPNVHHHSTTAGDFLTRSEALYDLVVCDMKMEARLTAELLLTLKPRLAPNARILTTLKLNRSPQRATNEAQQALRILRSAYELKSARQLYFNRCEITVLL